MAQPQPNYSDPSFSSSRERHVPAPITNLPVGGLSGESDPTREIRALVEQLQQSARDARNQVRTAEAERDDMAAQANHFRQQNEELRARFIEITSIIRERDSALEEVDRMSRIVTDTQLRLSNSVREIAEAQRQRDDALHQRKELLAQRNEGLSQLSLITQQRDELNRQLEVASVTLQESNRRIAEIQKQLASIREARDAAQARNGELSTKLAAGEDELAALRDELDVLRQSAKNSITSEQLQAATAEREQALAEAERLRGELEALRTERDAAQKRADEIAAELKAARESDSGKEEAQKAVEEMSRRVQEAQAQFSQLSQERVTALAAREEALASLGTAQQKIERLIRERDSIRQQSSESAGAQEAQLEALRAQLSIFEATNPEAAQHTGEIRELARRLAYTDEERRELSHRLEKQREETVDLAAQLRAAQDQIRQMSASLAEARLLTRGSSKPAAAAPAPAAPVIAELPPPVFDSGEAVSAMRQACQNFTLDPQDISLLREIATQARAYAEVAASSRIVAVERLGLSFADLVTELSEYPDRISPEMLRTIHQTIEFLAALATTRDLASAKDPGSTRVFAVDDEPEICEMVQRILGAASIKMTHAQDPAQALTELAAQQYDLILLDVNMPGINGFELCAQIRSLSVNSSTPVIFLTGFSNAEARLHSTMSGGNEFIGKPFLFPELTVKALTLMLKAQFHLA